jgi:hypothetical protein
VPTMPTNATIPTTGRARYLRYLLQRCIERPQLIIEGCKAALSPHIAYLDLAGETSRSVMIFSSQRSGSTLLGEILVSARRQRLIFEPLRGEAVGVSRGIRRGQFVDPGDDNPEIDQVLRQILSGHVRNLWSDRDNTSRLPRGRVIKDCFGTNLSPYVARHFPEVPLILLLRHPVATAHSVASLGWPDDLDVLTGQEQLMSEVFSKQRTLIERIAATERNTVPALVLRWCMENFLPLTMLPAETTCVVLYEDLVENPHTELTRIARFLRERSPALWSHWSPDVSLLARPSATAWRDGHSSPDSNQRVRGWQQAVSDEDKRRSLQIVQEFGLDWLYAENVEPLLPADEVLRAR